MTKPLGSYQRQSDKTSQILKLRHSSGKRGDNNLNLINNNRSSQEEREEKQTKRRSYHPQDFLSKVTRHCAEIMLLKYHLISRYISSYNADIFPERRCFFIW
jgi:hypothetical protein